MMNLTATKPEIINLSHSMTLHSDRVTAQHRCAQQAGSPISPCSEHPLGLSPGPDPHLAALSTSTSPWLGVPRAPWGARCCDPQLGGKAPRSAGEQIVARTAGRCVVRQCCTPARPAVTVCKPGESEIALPTPLPSRGGLGSGEDLVIPRTKKSALVRYF